MASNLRLLLDQERAINDKLRADLGHATDRLINFRRVVVQLAEENRQLKNRIGIE